jgi:hypothetical protein
MESLSESGPGRAEKEMVEELIRNRREIMEIRREKKIGG